jgi:alpha-N-acetylglucosamine transferase
MNLTTKIVVGVENKSGEVLPLTKDLIDVCKKYKIRYEVPLNLNLEDNGEDDVIDNELKELGLNCAESGDDGSEEEN